jgi:aryl-alcohol dehydrogenase-like predicted oxidoreductase
MEYRQLGSSPVKVSAVTFGAWAIGGWMWGGQDEQRAIAAMEAAIEAGVTSIDTAPIYGFGYSEELVGRVIKGRRDRLVVLTKYGMRWDCEQGEHAFDSEDNDGRPVKIYKNSRPESVIYECEQSLRRLGTDYIDVLQVHWRDHTVAVEETMGAVGELIKQGKVRAAGVSNYTAEEMEAARAVVPLASSQPPYSMVNRGAEHDVLPYCRENNVGVVCYSPLQRGLLTGKFKPGHQFDDGDHRGASPFFQPENIRRVNDFLDSIRHIADGHGATLAQLVINWTTRQPGITAALVGARDAEQAAANAGALAFSLSDEEMAEINQKLDALELEGVD